MYIMPILSTIVSWFIGLVIDANLGSGDEIVACTNCGERVVISKD